jgi:hypothetical protein
VASTEDKQQSNGKLRNTLKKLKNNRGREHYLTIVDHLGQR